MKRILIVVWSVLSFLWQETCMAALVCAPPYVQPETVVVFSNGMLTTLLQAVYTRRKIAEIWEEKLSPEEYRRVMFANIYNPTAAAISDTYESAKQKFGSDNAAAGFFRWIATRGVIPVDVQDFLNGIAASFDASTAVSADVLAGQEVILRSLLGSGKKVVDICHSQGNFFCNAEHNILYYGSDPIESKSFGIVSIANPASSVGGNGPYLTLIEDKVIGAVALATPVGVLQPLPPNVTNVGSGAATSTVSGHQIVDDYLAVGSTTRQEAFDDYVMMNNALVQPPRPVLLGAVTATLMSSALSGVGLDVMEPGGIHVAAENPDGVAGFLDFDLPSDAGQHYCATPLGLPTGTYTIGLDYFFGVVPDTATVQVTAGYLFKNYTVPLTYSGGFRSGPSILVAKVVVGGSWAYGFTFDVQDIAPAQ